MKCIVFGLGNFGLALSQRLTKRGNEVLGVDSDISKINLYKDSITNTVALDVKNEQALQTLPLTEVDVVFVVFGKDFGTSLSVRDCTIETVWRETYRGTGYFAGT